MIDAPAASGGPADEALAAARRDPRLMGDSMRGAWTDWIGHECRAAPVLLVLEDLHWGDRPSVDCVDVALRIHHEAPLMVLALARPSVRDVFGELWSDRAPHAISLDGLSRRAARQLVRGVLGNVDATVIEGVVERAQGNAFYLEELIRAVAGGADVNDEVARPGTVLGMVQSRLDALAVDAKRVLRAASVYGEAFWQNGVEALIGPAESECTVAEWLDDLVRREIVTESDSSRLPGTRQFAFRHALVHDAAYAMLTDEDLRLGHRLAGSWLEASGERDALALAAHYVRGDAPELSVPWFRRAAEQALEGNDFLAVVERADAAMNAGAQGVVRGALLSLTARAAYWQSDYEATQRRGSQAAQALERGTAPWFRAVPTSIVASARLGDYARVDDGFRAASSADPADDARPEQLVCLARGTFQLIFAGRFEAADAALARIAELAGPLEALDAYTRAQIHHVRGVRAAHIGDVGAFLRDLEAAVHAFEAAGDRQNPLLERTTVAWCYAEVGDFERAEAIARHNLEACRVARAQQAITYAEVNLGYILVHRPGCLDEAATLLEGAAAACARVQNRRLQGWALAHLTEIDHIRGEQQTAQRHASDAETLLAVSPGLQAWARATHGRALLALGRVDAALALAEAAMTALDRLGGLLQGESLPPLLLASARMAAGDAEGARAAAEDAMARLTNRADRLGDARWRELFLARAENMRTAEIASAVSYRQPDSNV